MAYCHHFAFIFVFRKPGHISTFFPETTGTIAPNLGRNIIIWSATNCMCSVTISNFRWTSPRNGHSFNIRPYRKKLLKNKYSLKPMNEPFEYKHGWDVTWMVLYKFCVLSRSVVKMVASTWWSLALASSVIQYICCFCNFPIYFRVYNIIFVCTVSLFDPPPT